MSRPPFLLRLYAFLMFPFSREGSLVWWWRMHANTHGEGTASAMGIVVERDDDSRCPYCTEAPA